MPQDSIVFHMVVDEVEFPGIVLFPGLADESGPHQRRYRMEAVGQDVDQEFTPLLERGRRQMSRMAIRRHAGRRSIAWFFRDFTKLCTASGFPLLECLYWPNTVEIMEVSKNRVGIEGVCSEVYEGPPRSKYWWKFWTK